MKCKFINFLTSIFDCKKQTVETTEETQEVILERTEVPEEIQEQVKTAKINPYEAGGDKYCEHQFGRYKFVKGGGRETTCKICGYVKHVD